MPATCLAGAQRASKGGRYKRHCSSNLN